MSLLRDFVANRRVYLAHITALLRPGHAPRWLTIDTNTVGDISAWSDEDVEMLLSEGRRHDDRMSGALAGIRSRAQHAFTMAVALMLVIASQLSKVTSRHDTRLNVIFWAAVTFVILGLLGALAVLVIQVQTSTIHSAVVSRYAPPSPATLAIDYVHVCIDNQNSMGTLLTVFRESALYLTIGAALDGLVWVLLR